MAAPPALPKEAVVPKGRVPIKSSDGSVVGTVPEAELKESLSQGFQQIDHKEYAEYRLDKLYGGAGETVKTVAEGALSGPTLGLSDYVARKVAPEYADRAALRAQTNPIARGTGEIGGIIGATLLTAGAAGAGAGAAGAGAAGAAEGVGVGRAALGAARGAANVLSSPVRAAGALAEGAGGVITKKLGGGVFARAAGTATQWGLDNAALGLGHEISQSALKNEPLVTEHLVGSLGRDFMLGAILGGGGSLAASAIKPVASKAGEAISGLAGRKADESLGDFLSRKGDEMLFKAARPTAKEIRTADRVLGGAEDIGGMWRREAPEVIGRDIKTFADIKEFGEQALAKYRPEYTRVLEKMDEAAEKTGNFVKVADVFGKLDEYASQAEKQGLGLTVQNSIQKEKDILTGMLRQRGIVADGDALLGQNLPFQTVKDYSRSLSGRGGGGAFAENASQAKKIYADLRRDVETTIEDKATQVAGDTSLASAYRDINKKYQAAYEARDITQRASAAAQSRSAFGNAMQTIGMSPYGAVGGAVGSMIGGVPGAIAGAVTGGYVKKLVDEYADVTISRVLQSTSQLSFLTKSAAKSAQRLQTAADDWLLGKKTSSDAAPYSLRLSDAQVQRIATMAANVTPETAPNIAAGIVGQRFKEAHPQVALSMVQTLSNALEGLGRTAPKVMSVQTNQPTLFQQKTEKMSKEDIQKYRNNVEIITSGAPAIVERLNKNTLKPSDVLLYKQVYPEQYNQLREIIRSGVEKMQASGVIDKVPYQKKLMMGILFGAPSDGTQDLFYQTSIQSLYAQKAEQTKEQGKGGRKRSPSLDKDPNIQYTTSNAISNSLEGK